MWHKNTLFILKSGLLPAVSAVDLLPATFALPEKPKSEPLPAVSVMQRIHEHQVNGSDGMASE